MNYVLGGGLSGLIAGYYLNIPIITDNIGGQLNSPYILGPRYLYNNIFCRKLLDDLGIKYSIREVKYSYYYRGKFYEKVPKWVYDLYRQKTQRYKIGKLPKNTKFEVLVFDYTRLINKLIINNKIICSKIIRIDLDKKIIYLNTGKRLNYVFLISTLPAPTFLDLTMQITQDTQMPYTTQTTQVTQITQETQEVQRMQPMQVSYLRYLPIYYNVCKSVNYVYDEKYDYIYYVDKEIPYYRISRIYINDVTYYVHESVIPYIPKNSIYFTYQRIGKIIVPPHFNYNQFKNIYFIGRYAIWDEDYFIHHSIRDILNIKYNKYIYIPGDVTRGDQIEP